MLTASSPQAHVCRSGLEDAFCILMNLPRFNATAGQTALFQAAWAGFPRAMDVLLQNSRADTDARNEKGWSALHVACLMGHAPVVKQLLQHGVSARCRAAHEQRRTLGGPVGNLAPSGSIPTSISSLASAAANLSLAQKPPAHVSATPAVSTTTRLWTALHAACQGGHAGGTHR